MTFSVLGFTGSGYGLTAGVSVLCYLWISVWLNRKTRFDMDAMLLYGVLGIPLGLFISRIFFCATNGAYFFQTLEQPEKMLYFWDGGYSMTGMLLGLVLAAWIAAKIKKLNFKAFLDAVTLPLGVLLIGLRLAEGLTDGLGFGRQVEVGALAQSLPVLFVTEKMGVMELYRLAVFRYEAVFALIILGLMVLFKRAANRREGDLAMLFFALYGAGQVLFESMRSDGHMVMLFIRVQQVTGLLMPLTVLFVLCTRYAKRRGARGAVTAAWTMLPIMAFVLILMVAPINHVLDLSGHIPLGIGILAAFALYLAFFLRTKGANLRLILTWVAALLTMAACVLLEFSMDGSADIFRDYALLALCAAVLFLCPYTLYRTLQKQEVSAG